MGKVFMIFDINNLSFTTIIAFFYFYFAICPQIPHERCCRIKKYLFLFKMLSCIDHKNLVVHNSLQDILKIAVSIILGEQESFIVTSIIVFSANIWGIKLKLSLLKCIFIVFQYRSFNRGKITPFVSYREWLGIVSQTYLPKF